MNVTGASVRKMAKGIEKLRKIIKVLWRWERVNELFQGGSSSFDK